MHKQFPVASHSDTLTGSIKSRPENKKSAATPTHLILTDEMRWINMQNMHKLTQCA